MDFSSALWKEELAEDFANKRLVMSTKESVFSLNRPHTSLSMVRQNSLELLENCAINNFKNPSRYITTRDLSYDLFVSFFDVNSKNAIALRFSKPLEKSEISQIHSALSRLHRPNIEMRIIGGQNADSSLFDSVVKLQKTTKASIVEVDLFGNMKRHLALDLKTGASYDLLLEDRVYRAGELINNMTPEAYKTKISKLKFV